MELPLQDDFDTSTSQIKPVSDITTIATDLFLNPVVQAADTDNNAPTSEEPSTASAADTQTPPTDIVAVAPVISLPVDTTSGTDQSTLPPVDETQQLPPDIAIDPISLPVDTTSGTDQSTTPPVDIAVDQPIEPIYTFPTDFGGFIECGSFISAGFIDYGWMTVVSAPTPTFADITFAEATITLPPPEPIVLDSSLNLDVSDNVVTDAPAVSLIGVPDISVQAF